MRHEELEPKVSLPPEVADWMGAAEVAPGAAVSYLDVPAQRGWRERLKDLLAG